MRSFLLFVATLLILPLSAQIRSGNITYDKTTMPSLRMTIDAPMDEVEDQWEDFWDDQYDVDIDKLDKDRNSIAYKAEQVSLPLVSQKNVNLYTKIAGLENSAEVALAFSFTSNDIVTERAHPDAYRAAESIMNEFRTRFYTKYFDEMIAEVRDDLDDARDDSQDDSKDAEKARKKIKKYRDKIEDYEEKIEEMRDEVGDELESSEEKARRARELETKLRDLQNKRSKYLR